MLTHCNAAWLATVDWGTALAPIYKAHNLGIPVHVWVDETYPRKQGVSLTTTQVYGSNPVLCQTTPNWDVYEMETGDNCMVTEPADILLKYIH